MVMENLSQRVNQMSDHRDARNMYLLLEPLFLRLRSFAASSAGLVISATTTKVKTGASVFHYVANGVIGRIAAGTDMPVLVGTVTNALFNIFVFTVDKAGTTYTQMGTEAATEAAVRFPALAQDRAIIGWIIVNPTGTGNFVGGTTALGDVTVVPNTVYISPIGVIEPTSKII